MGINLIADVNKEVGNPERVEKELGEAVALTAISSQVAAKKPEVKTEQLDATIPDKYKGKTLLDVVQMHQNAESQLGRMANDLGVQRKMTDQLLGFHKEQDLRSTPAPTKVTREELIMADDPTPALEKFVTSRLSRVEQQTAERMDRIERSLAERQFVTNHPDYRQLANDPAFVQWTQGTMYRIGLGQAAAVGDWGAADALFSEYKEQQKLLKLNGKTVVTNDDVLEAARKAALESGSGDGEQPGDAASGKKYRRSDLLRLRMENPDAYYSEDFQKEIIQAYDKKRVR